MANTNPFQLLEGDNEDPTQLAAAATKKVPAVRAVQAPSQAGDGREVGHGYGRRKPRKTSKVAQSRMTTNVNLAEKNLGDDEPNGDDKLEEKEAEMPKLEDVDEEDDKPAGDKGVGDDKKEDKEMTNGTRSLPQLLGMLFEFLCTLFRIPFRVARYFYASLESVFTAPASGASEVMSPYALLKASTIPRHPTLMKKMLRDLSHVIPDPPPVVDSDALRHDNLHDKGNRMAEYDDLCLKIEELIRFEQYFKKKKAELVELTKSCSTVDDYQNWNKWGLKLIREAEAVQEKVQMVLRRVQKYLLFELYYHK